MKDLIDEFKEFINRGNVLDMAVGVIIGSAFTSIVNSLVDDVIMPVIGIITGGVDFSSLQIGIGSAQVNYGNFLNAVISFLVVALSVFVMLKAIKALRKKSVAIIGVSDKKEEKKEEAPKPVCPFCLEEIKQGASCCPHCGSHITASNEAALLTDKTPGTPGETPGETSSSKNSND